MSQSTSTVFEAILSEMPEMKDACEKGEFYVVAMPVGRDYDIGCMGNNVSVPLLYANEEKAQESLAEDIKDRTEAYENGDLEMDDLQHLDDLYEDEDAEMFDPDEECGVVMKLLWDGINDAQLFENGVEVFAGDIKRISSF